MGRGSQIAPANRYERTRLEDDFEQCEGDEELLAQRRVPTEFLADRTRSIITENDSPDVGFRYSINPYRGCEHGCSYCYARPSHEMLGLNAGHRFRNQGARQARCRPAAAGRAVRQLLARRAHHDLGRHGLLSAGRAAVPHHSVAAWRCCWKPARPCRLITKNVLVLRDLDLLTPLAELHLVQVFLSVTTLDADLARTMEPRTATPAAKLRAIAELSRAGVPVGVMVAPVIPGLTDTEMPQILRAAKDAGAESAGYVLLRLPWTVQPVFLDWLSANRPAVKERVEALIRETRDGKLYDSSWKARQRGQGAYAEQIGQTFKVFTRKLGLDRPLRELDTTLFRPPRPASGQLSLF